MVAGPKNWWRDAQDELAVARGLKATGSALQAYFHAGQSVEFALKAIYMRRKCLLSWPDECKGATWHSLSRIATYAGLDPDLTLLSKENRPRYVNWLTARDWDSNGRFPGNRPSVRELNDLFLAICHERDGIMEWLEIIFQKS